MVKYKFTVLRANQEQIADAFIPTLRTLFNAPTTSPLAQIDAINVAELLVHLTSDKHLVNSSQSATRNQNIADDVTVGKNVSGYEITLCFSPANTHSFGLLYL